ncbi:MAG: VCBS repeat-containing protein, partial [Chitinophagaceae bacterium]
MNEPVTSGKIEVQQANTCFKIYCYFFLPFLYITFSSCSGKQPLFTLLSSSTTGVDFKNELTVSDSLNIMNYIYLYNGGGVATGDINNDGLADIYFTSNQGDNKLFLNKGHLQFEDITAIAGVKGEGNWKTGVTMADVNGDGWLDIYVCAVGGYEGMIGRNQLYINNGKLGFSDEAAGYGLNEEGFNTQSTFLDYDKDGDLDVFIVKHAVHSTEKYSDTASRHIPDAASGDKLFRNETSNGKNFFVDVTAAAGIFNGRIGYGLNAIVNDFNNDGWPDIYVSNDFNEEDYYYLNNGNGSFSELNKQAFGHESHFSMGSDAADINNDGWVDLVTLDMLPADEKILKSSMPDDPLEIYQYKLGFGYQAQCSRNCLQLNRGAGRRFSDIALFSGIAATDWSWSPLLADFDNDGICDLFITNGIYRRPNDLDFMNYYAHTPEAYDATKKKLNDSAFNLMPPGMQSNYLFRGTSSLKFSEVSKAEGFSKQGFSNGAAYADFDNDGDLDLVLNNLNGYADIYRNNTNAIRRTNYISIQLKGNKKNKAGLGAAFELSAGSEKFHRYQTATRGFQSSSSGNVVIGLGNHQVIDTLRVTWPDSSGTVQEWYHVKTNQRITLQQDSASHEKNKVVFDQPLFTPIKNMEGIDFVHKENFFNDFAVQPLILHGVSTEGPKLAVGDVNGDGLDDFYACGAAAQAGALYIQDASGGFKKSNTLLFESDRLCEDVNAVFFDADNDKDPDLYVVSGGNEWEGNDFRLVDRLYVNDGAGLFTRSPGLPLYFGNKSVAAPGDIDKDGDMDLFVGGRVVAGKYGETPRSYLLVNDGNGKFTIET